MNQFLLEIGNPNIEEIKENYLHHSHEETKEMQTTLLEMGFEENMIDNMFCFNTVLSIEQAVQLLTKDDNGVWQHNKIIKGDGTCMICGEYGAHIGDIISDNNMPRINQPLRSSFSRPSNKGNSKIKDDSFNFSDNKDDSLNDDDLNDNIKLDVLDIKNSNYEEENENDDNNTLCEVCYTDEKVKLNLSKKCHHDFCLDCWKEYINNKINNNDILNITCMKKGCRQILNERDILIIFDNDTLNETFQKYKLFVQRKQKEEENLRNNGRKCPYPDCDGYLHMGPNENKYATCEYGHNYCYNCLQPWHGNKSCNEVTDQKFLKWTKKKRVIRCPKCGYFTEKNKGCNHMTCVKCKHQWCWLCLKPYSAGHYSEEGPCNGKQFYDPYQPKINFIGYYFLLHLIILCASIIGLPVLCVVLVYEEFMESMTYDFCFSTFIIAAGNALLGLCYQPAICVIGCAAIGIILIATILFPPLCIKIGKLVNHI